MNLQNLVDYCQEMGLPDPFSGASVPAPLDLDAVKSAIMVRCGLLTPVYGEPDVFTRMTTHWFFTKQWTFEHLIKVIQAEYNPVENVFELRNEKTKYGHVNTKTGGFKDTNSGKDTVTNSGKDVSENSGKDVTAYTGTDNRDISNTGTDTTTNTVSAYNTSGYQADNQSALLHGHTVDDDITYGKTETVTNGLKNELTHGLKTETDHGHALERVYNSEKDTESGTDELIVSRHGNVGTISADRLIQEELALLRHFDIYSYIAELFENDNMLMIY